MKIITIAEIPDELGNAWFQHVRNFNVAHPECKFQAVANAPDKSVKELKEMLNVQPSLAQKS